mmetsp:Transcript_30029/g.82422  ORF Transcript_30029/g.82422 Transcript_30029/m.82422 type:complete len:210 (+) Transcript_30029:123-752(+)
MAAASSVTGLVQQPAADPPLQQEPIHAKKTCSAQPQRCSFSAEFVKSQLSWDDLARHSEQRTALCLRGLPREMCRGSILQALLKGAGLDARVRNVRISRTGTRRFGMAIVDAFSHSDVAGVARLFHGRLFSCGRRWGASLPVSVSFAMHQDEPQRVVYTPDGIRFLRGGGAGQHELEAGSTDSGAFSGRSSSPEPRSRCGDEESRSASL